MSEARARTGGCLCGDVRFTMRPKSETFGACHCGMCRRWSAGPYIEVDCAPGGLVIEDDARLAAYRSSEWAERLFCKTCGSSLFFHYLPADHYSVAFDALDDVEGLVFDQQIFIDEKPRAYSFAEDTAKMTGAEIIAKFKASQENDDNG